MHSGNPFWCNLLQWLLPYITHNTMNSRDNIEMNTNNDLRSIFHYHKWCFIVFIHICIASLSTPVVRNSKDVLCRHAYLKMYYEAIQNWTLPSFYIYGYIICWNWTFKFVLHAFHSILRQSSAKNVTIHYTQQRPIYIPY